MKHFFLDRQLHKIEKEANNDLLLLLEVSPSYYTTHELKDLLQELKEQENKVKRQKENLFIIGSSMLLWLCLSFLFQLLKLPTLAYVFMTFAPTALAFFVFGSIYIRFKHRFFRHAYLIEKIIQAELERRRKDASIF